MHMVAFQEWSEEESEEEESQQSISREDSGIQVDRTPQEDQERNNKTVQVTWTSKGMISAQIVTLQWVLITNEHDIVSITDDSRRALVQCLKIIN